MTEKRDTAPGGSMSDVLDRDLVVEAINGDFGAVVRGIDLTSPPDAALAKKVHHLMDTYAFLVLPEQHIDDDQEMAFAKALGTLEPTPAVVAADQRRLKHAEMIDISNLEVDGTILAADDRRRMFHLGNQLWHTDSSFKSPSALYSMLHAREVPPVGGETQYADMRAAWDSLPDARKQALRGLKCDHSLLYSRALLGFDGFSEEEKKAFAPVTQPLVRKNPATGRESLFLASHIGAIHGMLRPDAMLLIRDLMEIATQREFVYEHKWRQGDLVIWDNRCTMHRGRPYDDTKYRRDMRRLTLSDTASATQ